MGQAVWSPLVGDSLVAISFRRINRCSNFRCFRPTTASKESPRDNKDVRTHQAGKRVRTSYIYHFKLLFLGTFVRTDSGNCYPLSITIF